MPTPWRRHSTHPRDHRQAPDRAPQLLTKGPRAIRTGQLADVDDWVRLSTLADPRFSDHHARALRGVRHLDVVAGSALMAARTGDEALYVALADSLRLGPDGIAAATTLPLLATSGGDVVGAATLKLEPSIVHGQRIGYLAALAVDPAHRRSGVGGDLLAAVAQSARDANLDLLHGVVRALNDAAVSLYRSGGCTVLPAGEKTQVGDVILRPRPHLAIFYRDLAV